MYKRKVSFRPNIPTSAPKHVNMSSRGKGVKGPGREAPSRQGRSQETHQGTHKTHTYDLTSETAGCGLVLVVFLSSFSCLVGC